MEIDKACKKEILELMRKHNLTQTQVLTIYKAQWKFVKEQMKHDFKYETVENRKSIKLKGLGTFVFSPYMATLLTKRKIEKYEKQVLSEEIATYGDRTQVN
jgi:hypothetical protein